MQTLDEMTENMDKKPRL